MSSSFDVFKLTDDDALKFLVSESHIGTKKMDYQMEPMCPGAVRCVSSAIATPQPIQQHQPMPTQQRFVAFFEKKERGVDMHTSIKQRKNYINPALYEALRNAYGIDEKGTCFVRAVCDPNAFAADDFYDALGEVRVTRVSRWITGRMRHLKLMHRRFAEAGHHRPSRRATGVPPAEGVSGPGAVRCVSSAIATPQPIQQHQPMPTQQRFVAFFEKKERGVDMHTSIKQRKNYINTALYQALRNAYGIDEKGTCFVRAVYDPNAFAADDFYDALGFQSDPQLDHQTVREASYVNTPVIAVANTDSPLEFVDIVIPANNKMLLDLHKHIMHKTNPLIAGEYRRTDIEVCEHIAVPWEEVPAKMTEFVDWFNSHEHTTDLISLTAEVHYRLTYSPLFLRQRALLSFLVEFCIGPKRI
ncbi:hypothetical protein niasHT_024969 [Heterodera trifolii]|uniref:Fido domain-containing protein n=1 Tax=Heterodera trifolii TaxID=157864 RepID=A0ABD2JAC8_9BILA